MKNSCPGSARPLRKRELRAEIEELESDLKVARKQLGIAFFHIPANRAQEFLDECQSEGVGIGIDAPS